MRFSDLSPATVDGLRSIQWDHIIEKHEGPSTWDTVLKYSNVEFIEIDGCYVLLPIDKQFHPNVTILRCVAGDCGNVLTIFLKNTTCVEDIQHAFPDGYDVERFMTGFVSVCERVPGHDFFIAVLYHEWYVIDSILP
tara:strand:+ start:136 stop:546 length:411 start_codon:yes stop_codon:yes gene_type:complete